MNFFCKENEFDEYVEQMQLDRPTVIKADWKQAVQEAKSTFLVF